MEKGKLMDIYRIYFNLTQSIDVVADLAVISAETGFIYLYKIENVFNNTLVAAVPPQMLLVKLP